MKVSSYICKRQKKKGLTKLRSGKKKIYDKPQGELASFYGDRV